MQTFINILIGLLITVVSETGLFLLFGFKDKKFILNCIVINVITNLTLNISLALTNAISNPNYLWILLGSEIGVLLVETLYLLLIDRPNKRYQIIPLTLSANCLSFLLGCLYYWLVSLI